MSSTYQHLFSTNAVLNVWRNLRNNNTRSGDSNDLLLTFQYHADDVRAARYGKSNGKGAVVQEREVATGTRKRGGTMMRDGGGGMVGGRDGMGGKSISFVVPWRSMQTQKRELREKDKELAEALVGLVGEVAVCDLPPHLQTLLVANPIIQTRHIIAGLSRQLSRIEVAMCDNAPFSRGKNMYTGGEIAAKFLPSVYKLFEDGGTGNSQASQAPRQRMLFELLLELKDVVFMAMEGCEREVLERELWGDGGGEEEEKEGSGWAFLEEMDELMLRAVTPVAIFSAASTTGQDQKALPSSSTRLSGHELSHPPLQQTTSQTTGLDLSTTPISNVSHQSGTWLTSTPQTLHFLESLVTTSTALSQLPQLPLPITDFLAKTIITLRRSLDRHTLSAFETERKGRDGKCAEYARCIKWAGKEWKEGGGCRKGCVDEDEDVGGLPSWHRGSAWFVCDG